MEFLLKEILLLVLGLIFLYAGAEGFLKGAQGVMKKFNIPEYVVGATIVAIGTSLPEAVTSSYASYRGIPQISLSNVIGSNVFNIAMVLGFTATFVPIKVKRDIFRKDSPLFFFSTIFLFLIAANGIISRIEGIMLLILFGVYLYHLLKEKAEPGELIEEGAPGSLFLSIVFVALGAIVIYAGSKLAVDSAATIARAVGISEWVIGATVIAMGTSLPEFATSVAAIRRGMRTAAVGNVIGSNIVNIFLVVGAASTMAPLSVELSALTMDIPFIMFLSLLLILIINDREISRLSGIALLMAFIGYIFALLQVH